MKQNQKTLLTITLILLGIHICVSFGAIFLNKKNKMVSKYSSLLWSVSLIVVITSFILVIIATSVSEKYQKMVGTPINLGNCKKPTTQQLKDQQWTSAKVSECKNWLYGTECDPNDKWNINNPECGSYYYCSQSGGGNKYDLNTSCSIGELAAKTVQQCDSPCVITKFPSPYGGECEDKFDCGEGMTCVNNQCVIAPKPKPKPKPKNYCLEKTDCDYRQDCLNNSCVKELSCLYASDCKNGQNCLNNKCVRL